jgi:hypothetical protein
MMTIAPYTGTSKARQEVGDPGHCDRCVAFGHILAHPQLGCGDVGCNSSHDGLGLPPGPPPGIRRPRQARKRHSCEHCPYPISPGDFYWEWSLPPGQDPLYAHGWTVERRHAVCPSR